jgi:hypothetical protein
VKIRKREDFRFLLSFLLKYPQIINIHPRVPYPKNNAAGI